MSEVVLRVEDLVTTFPAGGGRAAVVDGVGFTISEGEVLSLVGESGCGKSMTALSILRLVPRPGRVSRGRIELCGHDVLSRSLLSGYRVADVGPEGERAADGVFVSQIGQQVHAHACIHEMHIHGEQVLRI